MEAEFIWAWGGDPVPWRLVVLNEDLEQVYTSTPRQERSFRADAALREQLEENGVYYWFVEAEHRGEPVRCSPALFRPSSNLAPGERKTS